MSQDLVADIIMHDEIAASMQAFDLTRPLTQEEELRLANQFDVSRTPDPGPSPRAPRELEDELYNQGGETSPTSGVRAANAEYQTYLRWQAIAAMVAHEEAWLAFQELVLLPYVRQRRAEDEGYQGDDRDKIIALRQRRVNAQEFVRHVLAAAGSAGQVPRPVLTDGKS